MAREGPRETWRLDGREVEVSHLEKVLWPATGLTKGDLLGYYRAVGPAMLPYLRDHPLTLTVFPRGIDARGFYRRDVPERAPGWLRAARYQPEGQAEPIQPPLVDDLAGLIWYANQDAIEFHVWLSRAEDLERPDWAVFDLDPGDEVGFPEVLRAALVVRRALDDMGLRPLAKTSGGRGLHLFLPLAPIHSFDEVRDWVRALATRLAEARPDLLAAARGATHRGDRVTIDHAQNSIARNTAAPYTARARPGATVSAPVSWEEVERGDIRPEHFTIRTMPERLERLGDLWAAGRVAPRRLPALEA
ncbi:MAG: non-homologous end-joining DNA ligase [Thermomicrobiaceae bacterium]|nr:non-homologous end-joining DNA ligase [Thermomicrobiaceae bacterium]